MSAIFDAFGPHAAMVAAVAARMIELGLTPDEVVREYDVYMEDRMRDMVPPPDHAPEPDTRRVGDSPDTEYRLGPCPKCGVLVWGIKKCPHVSPPWRAFFACDNEACDYHGRSRLGIDELRRSWPAGAEPEEQP